MTLEMPSLQTITLTFWGLVGTPVSMATPSLDFVVSSSLTAKKNATHKMVCKDGIKNAMDKAFVLQAMQCFRFL